MSRYPRARPKLVTLAAALAAGACGGPPSPSSSGTTTCSFSIVTNAVSPKMATVGIVEWSTDLAAPASARIVYSLTGADSSVLNTGGVAPVDLRKPNYRTLLLGLKQAQNYTFHIEATNARGSVCKSADFALPTTGVLTGAPAITRVAYNAAAQAKGFIVASSGVTYGNYAVIIDADGEVVWYAVTPNQCSRARMDYEGANMWMVASNEDDSGGEMRLVSMDGLTTMTDVGGLSHAHHDFAVLPGKIAAMVWVNDGVDPPSNLVEMNSDGSGVAQTLFEIGPNLYVGGTISGDTPLSAFHANSILYHPADDSFTIGDRYPNLYVKVSHAGALAWQFGGNCTDAPAGAAHCSPQSWQVNHGHHLLDDGTLLVFNNDTSGPSDVLEFELNTQRNLSAALVKDFRSGDSNSAVLGDVQRLPNGNTFITYSTSGEALEVDASWAPVQMLTGTYGYSDWRESLYGPPSR